MHSVFLFIDNLHYGMYEGLGGVQKIAYHKNVSSIKKTDFRA